MLNRLRTLFTPPTPETVYESNTEFASIRQMKNGRFRLLGGEFGNEVLGTYSRRRDAVRGAARRGLTLAEGMGG
jgi:hypothetical protein